MFNELAKYLYMLVEADQIHYICFVYICYSQTAQAMATAQQCDYGPGIDSYIIDYWITTPIITLLQIVLFIHCIYHGKHLKQSNVPNRLPAIFTVLQIIAILYHISAEIKGISGRYFTHWFNDRLFCNYTRYHNIFTLVQLYMFAY